MNLIYFVTQLYYYSLREVRANVFAQYISAILASQKGVFVLKMLIFIILKKPKVC